MATSETQTDRTVNDIRTLTTHHDPVLLIHGDGKASNVSTQASMQDLADMLLSDTEEKLIAARDAAEKEAARLRKQREAAVERLAEQATELVGKQKPDKVSVAYAKAASEYHGKPYEAAVREGSTDVAKETVGFTVYVWRADEEGKRPLADSERTKLGSKAEVVQFSAAMVETKAAIAGLDDEIRTAEAAKADLARRIANLPRLARQAKAAVVRATVSGELTDARDLIPLLDQVGAKALPAPAEDAKPAARKAKK
jgi:hypothetical protein